MNDDARYRRMMLVAYGNLALSDRLPVEIWWRHYLLHDVRMQFRRGTNTPRAADLVADGALDWLKRLRREGVRRLQLVPVPADYAKQWPWHADLMIVSHGPGGAEGWIECDETVVPLRAADRDDDARYYGRSDAYSAPLETYWSCAAPVDLPTPHPADWRDISNQVELDLASGPVTFQRPSDAAFSSATSSTPDWARWPIIPPDRSLTEPHALMRALSSLESAWENFSHCKNDSSPYQWADAAMRAEWDAWRDRLRSWVLEIQCLAANDSRWNVEADAGTPPDIDRAWESSRQAAERQPPSAASDAASGPVTSDPGEQDSSWLSTAIAWIVIAACLATVGWLLWNHTAVALAVVITALVMRLRS